ncbi:hypothetical protein FRC10_006116 [Ceratobasidium sp. 414]|nr:hypothetical protein FRC10_006116 [Ceratobasidium sp. 414]
MDEQQARWRKNNKRSDPASEGELLELERALGHLSKKRESAFSRRASPSLIVKLFAPPLLVSGRCRTLGMFHACVDGRQVPITDALSRSGQFHSLSFVGAVSTLLGQEGLSSQCLWYSEDEFDWFWARITNIQSLELRADKRFRGGTPCVWLTTQVAEYALATPHSTFAKEWDDVLGFFSAPPCGVWPRQGHRPDWWPSQHSGRWPGEPYPGEVPSVVPPEKELRQLIEELSTEPTSSSARWRRLGPKGDRRFPGQPLHNVGQLLDWDLGYDAGLKLTRGDTGSEGDMDEPDAGTADVDRGQKRRKPEPRERRSKRAKGVEMSSRPQAG